MNHAKVKFLQVVFTYMFILLVLLGGSLCLAGQWIVPDQPDMLGKGFRQAAFLGNKIKQAPYIYRTVIKAPDSADLACVAMRSSGYAYIWVDGKCVAGREVDPSDHKELIAAQNRILSADLSEFVCDGKPHVLVVSASKKGFVMDGAFFSDFERIGDITSNVDWTVTRFAPGSVLESHPIMTLEYDRSKDSDKHSVAWPVRQLSSWTATDESFISTAQQLRCRRIYNRSVDIKSRLATYIQSGDIISDGHRSSWSGLVNTDLADLRRAEHRLTQAESYCDELKKILATVNRPDTDRLSAAKQLKQYDDKLDALDQWISQLAEDRSTKFNAKIAAMVGKAFDNYKNGKANLAKIPEKIKNMPVTLNRSEDMYGWFELPEAFDGDMANWGIRLNPLDEDQTGKQISLTGQWHFQCDISDVGLEVGAPRGAKMENWLVRNIPHNWARDSEESIAAYQGIAWYGRRVKIPSEWAGLPVRLKFTVEGTERLWLNGRELSGLGIGYRKRTYDLPPQSLAYGSDNLIVIQVQGKGPYRGLAGRATVSCPRLSGKAASEPPRVDVASSALSPAVMLRPQTNRIILRHSGKAAMAIPQDGAVRVLRDYDRVKDRKLAANWVLLWMHPRNDWDTLRPILLVFQHNPRTISCRDGLIDVVLDGAASELVVAVRPWSLQDTSVNPEDIDLLDRAQLWSRLARAIPINFVALPAAGSDSTKATSIVYDYLVTKDDWETEPLKVAPLPVLAGVAYRKKLEGFNVSQAEKLQMLHQGWRFGPYYATTDTDRVTYSFTDCESEQVCAIGCDFKPASTIEVCCELASQMGFNAVQWVYPYNKDKGIFRNFKPSGGPWPAEIASRLKMKYIHTLGSLVGSSGKAPDKVLTGSYITAAIDNIISASHTIDALKVKSSFGLNLRDFSQDSLKLIDAAISENADSAERFIISGYESNEYELDSDFTLAAEIEIGSANYYSLDAPTGLAQADITSCFSGITDEMLIAVLESKCLFINVLTRFDKDSAPDVSLVGLIDVLDSMGLSWSVGNPRWLFDLRADGTVAISPTGESLRQKILTRYSRHK